MGKSLVGIRFRLSKNFGEILQGKIVKFITDHGGAIDDTPYIDAIKTKTFDYYVSAKKSNSDTLFSLGPYRYPVIDLEGIKELAARLEKIDYIDSLGNQNEV
jgi:hypothetical protein